MATVDAAGYETSVTCAAALLGETALLRELDEEFHFRPSALRCVTPRVGEFCKHEGRVCGS